MNDDDTQTEPADPNRPRGTDTGRIVLLAGAVLLAGGGLLALLSASQIAALRRASSYQDSAARELLAGLAQVDELIRGPLAELGIAVGVPVVSVNGTGPAPAEQSAGGDGNTGEAAVS